MNQVMKNLLLDSKDGEWGKGEASDDSVAMLAIRGTDFQNVRLGLLHSVPLRHIPNRIAVRKALRPLDIIFETAGGSTDRPTGRSVLLTEKHFRGSTSPITCASFARFLRIDPVKADPEYVFWLLQNMYNTGALRQYNTQHTGVARFQYTTFAENESLELPNLEEQRRIASILSAYDDLIENNTRRIAILEEMARRLYEEWFVRFRFPGHEGVPMVESELGLVPQGWQRRSLDTFGEVITGKTPSKANPDFYGDDVPFVKTPDMHGNAFVLVSGESLSLAGAKSQSKKTLPPDSLCISCIGTIGVVSITTEPCQTNQQINSIVLSDVVAREFLFLRLKDAKKTLENLGANGATMGNVNKSNFAAMEITAPPLNLLARFHEIVEPMFDLMRSLARKNQNLRTTRDLLLPKLISGELDVSTLP